MRRFPCRAVPVFVGFMVGALPVSAEPVLDVSFQPPLTDHGRLEGPALFAQTFTLGLSGFFTGIDLAVGREVNPLAHDDLLLSVVRTIDGRPSGDVLSTTLLPASHWVLRDTFIDPEAYRRVAFQPFAVNAGELLAITIQHANPLLAGDLFYWYGGGEYAGGQAFERISGDWASRPSQFDFALQTYVDVESVPEPNTLALVAIGLVSVAIRRFRAVRSRATHSDATRV